MKLTLEIPDDKAAFVLELLANLSYIKTSKPKAQSRRKVGPAPGQDTTDYLMASSANREQLLRAIENVQQGKVIYRDLIEE